MARAFAWVTLLAVLLGFQCAGSCAAVECHVAPKADTGPCPHHQDSPDKQAVCAHQHFAVAVPEPVKLKCGVAQPDSVLPLLEHPAGVRTHGQIRRPLASASPPLYTALRI